MNNQKPDFGVLNGVKVVFAAQSVAVPTACCLLADWGADVTWIENIKAPDVARAGTKMSAEMNRRNMKNIPLDIPSAEGRKILMKLLKDTDILMESSRGGQWSGWGLTDEVLWEANPKLVIVHVSGFGQYGDPAYVNRASYDPVGQAIGGMMYANTPASGKPVALEKGVADIYTCMYATSGALAAYSHALRTGQGESIDVSQYESVMRSMDNIIPETWNKKRPFVPGNLTGGAAGYSSYLCKDGNYIYMLLISPMVLKVALPIFGLEVGTEEFPAGMPVYRKTTPGGQKLEAAIEEYCAAHTAAEVEQVLVEKGIPASCILTFDQMLEHPHFKAREDIIRWETASGEEIYGYAVMPKMKNNPGQVWRPCPDYGQDTKAILQEIGYSEEEIAALYENNVVR